MSRSRIILLGASNLTRSIDVAIATARRAVPGPVEILVAMGHGRSYGMGSSVLGRWLPGITECGLWNALRQPAPETFALITDVGNDIMYEAPVPRIAGWLATVMQRLADAQANTVVTQLPLANLEHLSRAKYVLLRSLLFPRCRLSLSEVERRAHEVERHVRELASRYGFSLVSPSRDWYGFDPIHIKRCHLAASWNDVLSRWMSGASTNNNHTEVSRSFARRIYFWTRVPERRRLLRWHQARAQPAARYRDGTTVGFY